MHLNKLISKAKTIQTQASHSVVEKYSQKVQQNSTSENKKSWRFNKNKNDSIGTEDYRYADTESEAYKMALDFSSQGPDNEK